MSIYPHRRSVTDSTPLLSAHRPSADRNGPAILPVVQPLSLTDLSATHWVDFTPASFELDHCRRLAFTLIVILQLRKQKIAHKERSSDIYEKWTNEETRIRDVEILEEKVNDIWEEFLTQYHSPQELYDVLWTEFPLAQDTSSMTKVVNFLTSGDAPQKFVAHPVVFMTMSRAWKFGRPENSQSENRFLSMRPFRISPSKLHFLEFIFDLVSVVILTIYVMRPPNWPDSVSDNKPQNSAAAYPYTLLEVYLMLYAFSVLLSARGVNATLSTLTLVAFIPSLPSFPLPGSAGFSILLWVIFIRILAYHITTIFPNPLLLISHQRSFPLALFLAKGLGRILRPLFLFYFPVALIACFALSISLSGPISGPLMYIRSFHVIANPTLPDPLIIGAAPMDTRVVFLLLSVTVLLLVLSSAYILGTSTPVINKHSTMLQSCSALDFYSPEIGHLARLTSYHATVTYSVDYYFPPPFNVFEVFLVTIPVYLIRTFGHPHFNRATIASRIWYITVLPFMIIVTPFWVFLA